MKKIADKGYTIRTASWENDGDNYKTIDFTTLDKDKAKALVFICQNLFMKGGDYYVGNSMNYKKEDIVLEFYNRYKDYLNKALPDDFEDSLIFDCFTDIAHQLIGSSEYYDFRVCEHCSVTYLPEDILAEEIIFTYE